MNKHILITIFMTITTLICEVRSSRAQRVLGDHLGSGPATMNLDLKGFNIDAVKVLNSKEMVIGTANLVNNSSIALQVNGSNKAMLVPRVTDLLNIGTPSIPTANLLEGMIVYDLATRKFYVRDDNSWATYGTLALASGQFFIGDASGIQQQRQITGDVTFTNAGVSTIGSAKVQSAMFADQSVTPVKIANGLSYQYLKTNAGATGVDWVNQNLFLNRYSQQNKVKGVKMFVSDSGLVAAGTFGLGVAPISTAGPRMIWYPNKAAFKVGNVTAAGLLDADWGMYSAAMGNDAHARGESSFATGASTASGRYSLAMGNGSFASGFYSTAIGAATASNSYAIAFGTGTASNGFAVGIFGIASASQSVAIGVGTIASGASSFALGSNNSTDAKKGAFVFNDENASQLKSTADHQMTTRFVGGYRFFSNAASSIGVSLNTNGTSWNSVSDKRKKENVEIIDQEKFLSCIDTMKMSSWNYKGQDPKLNRHYGLMAQDFYAAFGKDSYGTIGNDTTIASADIDGVIMIALKGLVKRTADLEAQNKLFEKHYHDLQRKLVERKALNKALLIQLSLRLAKARKHLERSPAQQRKDEVIRVASIPVSVEEVINKK